MHTKFARFTFVTDRLIRLEWSADGSFEDRETLTALRQKAPRVTSQHREKNGSYTVESSALKIEYREDGRPLSETNLSIQWHTGGCKGRWHPGMRNRGNLHGTARTLDKVKGALNNLGVGLLSRDGWSVIDDSTTPLIENSWVAPRPPGERQDLYFLAFGSDFTLALKDASLLLGAQPLPPRYTLGYWWSRYWAYTDRELEQLIADFDIMKVPLDVLVIDMDWHLEGWTGYTWDKRYFPDPDEFLRWVKNRGLRVTLNLHPAKGIAPHESQYLDACHALAHPADGVAIPFDCTDRDYMKQYFKLLHHPEEQRGVDFWWIDWQQGKESKITGLDPLTWLNRLHFQNQQRSGRRERPLIMSRFGGLGSHRYPIGFSGDTFSSWDSLAFQPQFTATAANVLYGYWSHDIGGHVYDKDDPELHLRWLQYGMLSPILRTHTSKTFKAERRPWAFPQPYARLMRETIARRYELVPYIYSENRHCYDTGVSLCHPLYYEHPTLSEAYECPHQYSFGRSLVAAPICTPADGPDQAATQKMWVPPGYWFDEALGLPLQGPQTVEARYLLQETPLLLRYDTILPSQLEAYRLQKKSYSSLVLAVPPGHEGRYELYEDDGISPDYVQGRTVTIPISYQRRGTLTRVQIKRPRGNYSGFQATKEIVIRLPFTLPPEKVSCGAKTLPFSFRSKKGHWSYDGDSLTTIIRLGRISLRRATTVSIRSASVSLLNSLSGFRGLMARLQVIDTLATAATDVEITHPDERLTAELAQTGNRISRNPHTFADEVTALREGLRRLPKLFKEMLPKIEDDEKAENFRRAAAIYDAIRKQPVFSHFFQG